MFKKGMREDQLTFLAAPESLGQALFGKVEVRRAAERDDEKWSPVEVSCAEPSQT